MVNMGDDYYKKLRIPKTASVGEIKKAYLQMARENHPDRFTDPTEREEAGQRFQEITEAFNQLRDEKTRQEYDRSLTKETKTPEEEARLYFKNAELREQSDEFDGALKLYYEAMRLQPSNVEYILAAGRLMAKDKNKMRQSVDLFNRAMEIDPSSPDPHLELGAVYSRTGMIVRARRVYENALKEIPNHPELKRRFAQVKDK
jgi:DnaJ-class molecular chaperone